MINPLEVLASNEIGIRRATPPRVKIMVIIHQLENGDYYVGPSWYNEFRYLTPTCLGSHNENDSEPQVFQFTGGTFHLFNRATTMSFELRGKKSTHVGSWPLDEYRLDLTRV